MLIIVEKYLPGSFPPNIVYEVTGLTVNRIDPDAENDYQLAQGYPVEPSFDKTNGDIILKFPDVDKVALIHISATMVSPTYRSPYNVWIIAIPTKATFAANTLGHPFKLMHGVEARLDRKFGIDYPRDATLVIKTLITDGANERTAGLIGIYSDDNGSNGGNDTQLGEVLKVGSGLRRAVHALEYAVNGGYLNHIDIETQRTAMDGYPYEVSWSHVLGADSTTLSNDGASAVRKHLLSLTARAGEGKYRPLTEVNGMLLLGPRSSIAIQPVLSDVLINGMENLDDTDLISLAHLLRSQAEIVENLARLLRVSSRIVDAEIAKKKRGG